MPRRLKQRARSEGTEWASELSCCSAVKKVSARTLDHTYFFCSSCTAVRAHYTPSDRLISSSHGGDGAGEGDRAGQGRCKVGPGQARPGHIFLFLFFSFSHMVSNHKLGTLTYHTLSKVMIIFDKRVAVLPIFFFCLLWQFGPSLSFVLSLEEGNCGITREPLTPKFFSASYF